MFVKFFKGFIIKVEKFFVVFDFFKCLMVCELRLCDGVRVFFILLNIIFFFIIRLGIVLILKFSVGLVKGCYM